MQFLADFNKKRSTHEKIQQILQKAYKGGDVSGFKSKISDAGVPKEAIALIQGIESESESITLEIKALQ